MTEAETTLTAEPLTSTSTYNFTCHDIPEEGWGLVKLTAFVGVMGKRAQSDRWKIGRAVNLAISNMTAADREQWYRDTLPGWSKSTIDRMRRLAKLFKSPEDISEDAISSKRKPDERAKAKREAYKQAMDILDELIRRNPNNTKFPELQRLMLAFAPSMQVRTEKETEAVSA